MQFIPLTYAFDYSFSYSEDLLAIVNDPRNKNVIRLEVAPERTNLGHPLYLVKLTNFKHDFTLARNGSVLPKRKVLLTFGEHAREFVSLESFFHLVRNLTEGYREPCYSYAGQYSRHVLNHLELHMIGLTNPDGKQILEDRKDYCYRNNGRGVDLNRNCDWQFNGPGSSLQVGHEEYNGKKAWSEPESRFVRDLALSQNYKAYLSLHSGERQVFNPFVDTESRRIKRRRPAMKQELELIDKIIRESNGWYRNGGIAYEMNSYSADGTFFDWFGGVVDIDYSICAEIWGGPAYQNCFVQFNPESDQLHQDLESLGTIYSTSFLHFVKETTGRDYNTCSIVGLDTSEKEAGGEQRGSVGPLTLRQSLLEDLCKIEEKLLGALAPTVGTD